MLKATAFSGASTILNTVIGFVKTKAMAIILGTAGVGFIGQLSSFFLLVSSFASLGNNVGVTRFVASYSSQGEKEKINRLFNSVRIVIGGFVLLCVVVGIIFSRTLSTWILNEERYYPYIILALIGLPFTVLYNFYRSFFLGLLEIRYYVMTGVISALAGLALLAPLVYFFHLDGAVWHIALFAVVSLGVAQFFLHKTRQQHLAHVKSEPRIDRQILKDIFKFGAASLMAGTSLYTANLVARNIILGHLGFAQAGIYAAILQMSSQCIMLVLDSIGTYCYPRLSGLQDPREIVFELNQTLRLTLTLITPIIIIFVLLKELVIVLFLSHEFLPASSLIGLQLLGDAFKAVGWSIGVSLLPLKKLKAFAAIDIIWGVIFVSLCYFSVPKWGLQGAIAAYMAGFLFHVLANYFYARKIINYSLWPVNRTLLFLSMTLIIYMTTLYRFDLWHILILIVGAGLWSWKAVKRHEIAALILAVKGKLTS